MLKQACTTYGPRVKRGPRKPEILFLHLVWLIETPLKGVKTYHFGPLNLRKRKFLAHHEI